MTGHLPGVGFSLRTGLCKVADLCVSTGTDKIPLSWGGRGNGNGIPPLQFCNQMVKREHPEALGTQEGKCWYLRV